MKRLFLLLLLSLSAIAAVFPQDRYVVKVPALPSHFRPDTTAQSFDDTLWYGDTVKMQEYNADMMKFLTRAKSVAYVQKSGVEKVAKEWSDYSLQEILDMPLWYVVDGAKLYDAPESKSRRIGGIAANRLLTGVERIDRTWSGIRMGDGSMAYFTSKSVVPLTDKHKYGIFAPDQMPEELITKPVSEGYSDGMKAGKKFVFVILGFGVAVLLLTLLRYWSNGLRKGWLTLYMNVLLLLSLLEIWYFLSTGMNQVYWFLTFDHIGRLILYVGILMLFAWIQTAAFLNFLDDSVKKAARGRQKYLWMGLGMVAGYALTGAYQLLFTTEPVDLRFGELTVFFQILGQIPIGFVFAKNLKKSVGSKRAMFLIYYPVIAGCVISLLIGSIYIFIAAVVFFLLARADPPGPTEEEVEDARIRLRREQALEDVDRKEERGAMSAFDARCERSAIREGLRDRR